MNARIGIQLYTVKDAWWEDQVATLQRIASLGIAGVEAFNLGDVLKTREERVSDARLLRTQIADSGLEITGAHTLLPPADDADWMFEEMNELGSPFAIASTTERVMGFTRDALADADRIPRFADRLNALAELGVKHGVRIGYHTHFWEWVDVDGESAFDRLVGHLNPDVALEIDLFWAYSAKQDLAALISENVERVEFVHVKDGDGVARSPQVVPGTGEVPLEAALDAATELRWEILELDVVADDVDVWDVVAGGTRWLTDRIGSRG